jgi:hypothetical protein
VPTRSGFRWREGALFLAKIDALLPFTWSWPGIDPATIDPTTVTVSRDPCGRWYVSFAVDVPGPEQLPATGGVAGADLGSPTSRSPGHACGADVRHSGSSRVQSAVKQEPQGVSPGIPVLQGGE